MLLYIIIIFKFILFITNFKLRYFHLYYFEFYLNKLKFFKHFKLWWNFRKEQLIFMLNIWIICKFLWDLNINKLYKYYKFYYFNLFIWRFYFDRFKRNLFNYYFFIKYKIINFFLPIIKRFIWYKLIFFFKFCYYIFKKKN